MQSNQKDHGTLKFLLDFQQIWDEFPVAVDVDSELSLSQKIDLIARILIEEGISVADIFSLVK